MMANEEVPTLVRPQMGLVDVEDPELALPTSDPARPAKKRIMTDDCHKNSPAPVPEDAKDSSAIDEFRKLAAEFVGTMMLVYAIIGSGIQGSSFSDDVGIQVMYVAYATAGALYMGIVIFGPVSGAHLNPVVSMVDVFYADMSIMEFVKYAIAQTTGGILGGVMANIQFGIPVAMSTMDRFAYYLWISEVIITASLIVLIHGTIRTGQKTVTPTAVGVWVLVSYFFTSSTIFANPAVTIGRIFSNTFAGINPQSAGAFIASQFCGGVIGYGLTRFFYPREVKVNKDDNLYRRAMLVAQKSFIKRGHY